MKLAVVAANGRVAGKVIAEALNRGLEVTAFGKKRQQYRSKELCKKRFI